MPLHTKSYKMIVAPPECLTHEITIPNKLLMGPGPGNASTRVLNVMSQQLLGHLHPEFIKIMDDVKEGIKYLFQTESEYSLAVSGTGHAALEAALVNLIECDTVVLVAVNGEWGMRASKIAEILGADVRQIHAQPGTVFTLEYIQESLERHRPKVFFLCHSESSTGVLHPLQSIGAICHRYNCLFVVDTVASIGGVPFSMDELEIDVVYCGSQKCLSAPPAPSPMSFSSRAVSHIKSRTKPVTSFYFDMNHLFNYWGCEKREIRRYHHTGMISNVYALREALAELAHKGLDISWQRHRKCAKRLWSGLEDLGLDLFVKDESVRLPTVTTIEIPKWIDGKATINYLMNNHKVEISGGLGPTTGRVWRIGLMGRNATEENVDHLIEILREALPKCKVNAPSQL